MSALELGAEMSLRTPMSTLLRKRRESRPECGESIQAFDVETRQILRSPIQLRRDFRYTYAMKVRWPREVIEEVTDAYWLGKASALVCDKALIVEQGTKLAKIIGERRTIQPPPPEAKKPVLH
jgi:hypothetical protein